MIEEKKKPPICSAISSLAETAWQVALMLGCWATTEHKTIKGRDTKGSTDTINSPISSCPGFSVKANDCLQQILCRTAKLLGAAQGRGSAEGVPSGWNLTRCPAAAAQLSSGASLACFPWGWWERKWIWVSLWLPFGTHIWASYRPHSLVLQSCSSLPTASLCSTPLYEDFSQATFLPFPLPSCRQVSALSDRKCLWMLSDLFMGLSRHITGQTTCRNKWLLILPSVAKTPLEGKCRRSEQKLESSRGFWGSKSSNREVVVNFSPVQTKPKTNKQKNAPSKLSVGNLLATVLSSGRKIWSQSSLECVRGWSQPGECCSHCGSWANLEAALPPAMNLIFLVLYLVLNLGKTGEAWPDKQLRLPQPLVLPSVVTIRQNLTQV